jgi:hypothetical protein
MTRAEAQKAVNELYMHGKITREEWSDRFDELSSNRWDAKGSVRLKKETTKDEQPARV